MAYHFGYYITSNFANCQKCIIPYINGHYCLDAEFIASGILTIETYICRPQKGMQYIWIKDDKPHNNVV